jgi:biotin operon repressor
MVNLNKYNYNQVLDLKLKPTAKAIVDCILSHIWEKGKASAYPSQERIAKMLHITRQSVNYHIQKLRKITINGLPFIVVTQMRNPENGKWDYNMYMFPWLLTPEFYARKHYEKIILDLQKEYYDLALQEEIENYRVKNFDRKNYNRQNTYFSIEDARKLIEKLSTVLELSKSTVLKTIINIGYELVENRLDIYHWDKYLTKCFSKSKMTQSIEEMFKKIYQSLGITGTDIHCIDWQSYANDLLKL